MTHTRRTSVWMIVLALVWLALLGGAVALAVRAITAPSTPPYYADEQAREGRIAFAQHCASCHGPELAGISAPALVGDPFWDGWQGRSVEDLLTYVRTEMPPDRPGALADVTYAGATAYVLAFNGFPGGEVALRTGDERLGGLTLAPDRAGEHVQIPGTPDLAGLPTAGVGVGAGMAGRTTADEDPGGPGSPAGASGGSPVYLAQAQAEEADGAGEADEAEGEGDASADEAAGDGGEAEGEGGGEAPRDGAADGGSPDDGEGGADDGGADGASADGAAVYEAECASCHGPEGGGGTGPALAGNDALQDAQATVEQIVHGGGGMPAFGDALSDAEIAAVATHVRTSWENDFGEVSVDQVAQAQGDGAGSDAGGQGDGNGTEQDGEAGQDGGANADATEGEGDDGGEDSGDGDAADASAGDAADGGDPDPNLSDEGTVVEGADEGEGVVPEAIEAQAPDALAFGETLFARRCAACHGADGSGGIGPALAGNPRLDDEAWTIRRILIGGNAMPAFAAVLSPEGVAAVTSHVRAQWASAGGETGVDAVNAVAEGLTQEQLNPVAAVDLSEAPLGQQRYLQLCAACHGAQGGGEVGPPLAGNENLDNVQLVLSTVVHGRGLMPAFAHHTDEELAAIASYVRTAWSNAFGPIEPAQVSPFRPRAGERAAGGADGEQDGAPQEGGGADDANGSDDDTDAPDDEETP